MSRWRKGPKSELSTARWQRLREFLLAREPLCRTCLGRGLATPATEVDHIVPRAWGGAVWDFKNLQPICETCHEEKSALEKHKPVEKNCDPDGFPVDGHLEPL